jgi:hypothetical protein
MAEIKRRTLIFSTGKQVKLFGNSVGIGRTLEVGEGYAPNLLAAAGTVSTADNLPPVNNPHGLTPEEIMELADHMMGLWLQLKENIRRYGLDNGKLFPKE